MNDTKPKGPVWVQSRKMPVMVCPNCGDVSGDATTISKDGPEGTIPTIGMPAICFHCGSFNIVTRDGLESGTAEQLQTLDPDFRSVIESTIRKPIIITSKQKTKGNK